MTAKFTGVYKLIQQNNIETTTVSDNQELGDPSSFGNYNWYHKVIEGSGSRISKYREWDHMDVDIDIARALDILAEEITGNCSKNDEPLEIDVIDLDHMTTSEITTVKTALRHWCEIHRWKNRLFNIARYTIKYGDVFFDKRKSNQRWRFIHPKDVKGAIVDTEDVTNGKGWQINMDLYDARNSVAGPISGLSGAANATENYTSEEIVRFTLNDDMSTSAPFGNSVLNPIYKTYKQKELLEDAVIIYRIQRAPERRVFYIDVGKMPPARVKQYLEQVRNEIKQKKAEL